MRSIWAVAQNTLAQALRMKIAVVTILLLLILLPLMGKIMDGDGTLLGKLQTFTSYSLALVSVLLCILTISIAAFTLSNDLKRKYIFMIITKPIRRTELIAGKLLGIIMLNVLLLSIFSVIVYALTMLIWNYSDVSPEQKLRAQTEFFTSRVGVKTVLDEETLKKRANDRFKQLDAQGQIPEGMTYLNAFRELYGQEVMISQKVDPGQIREWTFENVRVSDRENPDTVIFIRYKLQAVTAPADESVYGRWRIGDLRQFRAGGKVMTPVYPFERGDALRTVHEFTVPADAVTDDGFLQLAFYNDPGFNQTTIIPEDIEVLYRTGGFTQNYIRAVLLVFVRLIFLAVLGVSLSTWLSFPVAILVCLAVFFAGLTNGFILDAIDGLASVLGLVYMFTVKPLLWLLPQFDGIYNPGLYIVEGRTLRWTFLAFTAGVTLMIKALLMLLLGMFVFSRREVAKAVV